MFVNFNILNQLGSPAINSNTFANRPAAGQTGRLFVSTDTFEIYRDNGTTWDLIGGPGSSTITGTGTATQVAFFTSSQAIGSNVNLYWDNVNERLGIGTTTPASKLDIAGSNTLLHLKGGSNAYMMYHGNGVDQYKVGYTDGAASDRRWSIYDETGAKEVLTIDKQTRYVGIDYQYASVADQPAYTFDVSGSLRNTTDAFLSTASGVVAIGATSTLYNQKLRVVGQASIEHNYTQAAGLNRNGLFSELNTTTPNGASYTAGLAYTALAGYHLNVFQGSATIPNSCFVGGTSSGALVQFTLGGTVTINQGSGGGLRSYSGFQTQFAFVASQPFSTITHASAFHAYAPFYTGANLPTITNYYGIALNDTTEYTALAITNRWGVYQAGASDLNYFAANTLIGTTVNSGQKLVVNGATRFFQSTGITTIIESDWDRSLTNDTQLYIRGYSNTNKQLRIGFDTSANQGYIQALTSGIGTNDILINPSGGNVGIGTTSPASLLHTSGTSNIFKQFTTANNATWIEFQSNSSGRGFYVGQDNSTGVSWFGAAYAGILVTSSADPIVFGTNSLERMRITSGGNVEFKGIIYTDNLQNYTGGTTPLTIKTGGAQSLILQTNSTDRLTITSGGKVGIGLTSNINQSLTILDQGDAESLGIYRNFTGAADAGTIFTLGTTNGSGVPTAAAKLVGVLNAAKTDGYFVIQTVSSSTAQTRVQVESNGNVLIGTTTDAGYKTDVAGTFRNTTDSYFNTTSGATHIGVTTGATASVPNGKASLIHSSSGTIFSYTGSLPNPYSQNIQIDIAYSNWGFNNVIGVVDLIVALREWNNTGGTAFGKVLATTTGAAATFSTFNTTDITTSQCTLAAASGGNYTLRITIDPSNNTDIYSIYMNVIEGGVGISISSITVTLV